VRKSTAAGSPLACNRTTLIARPCEIRLVPLPSIITSRVPIGQVGHLLRDPAASNRVRALRITSSRTIPRTSLLLALQVLGEPPSTSSRVVPPFLSRCRRPHCALQRIPSPSYNEETISRRSPCRPSVHAVSSPALQAPLQAHRHSKAPRRDQRRAWDCAARLRRTSFVDGRGNADGPLPWHGVPGSARQHTSIV